MLRVLLWKVPGIAFPFGLLLPLAAVGLGVAWRRAPVLAASVVLLGLAVAAFFVTARYRAPLVPLLALFAAAGRAVGGRRGEPAGARGGRLRSRRPSISLANLGQGPMPLRMNADAEQGLAHWLEREGRRPEALALYERLAREAPASFDAWYGVAQLATALGQPAEAAAALATDPRARAGVPGHRAPPGAGGARGRVRGRGGGLRPPRDGRSTAAAIWPGAHGGGGRRCAPHRPGAPPAAAPTGSSSRRFTLAS